MNPEHHYHIKDKEIGSIFICEDGSVCKRNDSYDIFGNKVDSDNIDISLYKMVIGFKPGEFIPKNARYLNTVLNGRTPIHYFEIKGTEILKETIYNDNNSEEDII